MPATPRDRKFRPFPEALENVNPASVLVPGLLGGMALTAAAAETRTREQRDGLRDRFQFLSVGSRSTPFSPGLEIASPLRGPSPLVSKSPSPLSDDGFSLSRVVFAAPGSRFFFPSVKAEAASISFSPSPIFAAGESPGLRASVAIGTSSNGSFARAATPLNEPAPREAIGAAAEPSSPRRAGIRPLAMAPMASLEPARANDLTRPGPNGGLLSGALFNPASGGEDLNPIVTLTGSGGNSGGGDGSGGGNSGGGGSGGGSSGGESSGGGNSGGEGNPKPGGQEITGSGEATLETLIPVGTIMAVKVAPPSGGYALKTVTVGGMSNISSYISIDADKPPPATMKPETNVITNPKPFGLNNEKAETTFIVDATPRQYNIEVTATYTHPDTTETLSGTTKIHFTSDRPETASLSVEGQAGFSLTTAGGNAKLVLNDEGMTIVSQTKAAETFGGEFMFMQLVNSYRSVTILPGTPIPFDTGSFYIDDAEPGHLPAIGYLAEGELPDKSGLKKLYSWPLGPGEAPAFPFAVGDAPGDSVPVNGEEIVMSDSFRTYLMFRPAGGVWVALSQYNWSYQVAARNDPVNGWMIAPGVLNPIPGNASTPTGDDAFPTWHGRMSSVP